MRKYGISNFVFELLERCENNLLDEKEKYYIKLYDSKNNGYNEAIGGKGKPLWSDKQIEACKILYENNWLLKDISNLFSSNPKTVGKKLKEKYGINTRRNSYESFSKKIYAQKGEIILNFNSVSEAGRYIIKNHLTQSEKLECVISKISDAIRHNERSAYGFKWFYKDTS